MAEDGTKGRATRKPQPMKKPAVEKPAAKKPPAKAASTPARTAKTRAEPAAKAAPKAAPKAETAAKAAPKAAPKVESETTTGSSPGPAPASPPASGSGGRRPLPMGLLGGLGVVAVLAVLALTWPGAGDRLGQLFSGSAPSTPVATPTTTAAGPPAAESPAAESPAAGPPTAGPPAAVGPWAKLADRLGALEGSLARLSEDIAALKSAPAPGPDGAAQMAALEKRLAALEARSGGRAASDAALAAMGKRLGALSGSLKALEARPARAPVGSEGAGSFALLTLAGALRRGAPHGALVARATAALAESDGGAALAAKLHALGAYGAKGVPDRAALAARLTALPRSKPQSSSGTGPKSAGNGFWGQVAARLEGLIKFRRVDETGAPVPKAENGPWAKASRAMAGGDLAAALAAIKGVEGAKLAAWRRDAKARLKADALADDLELLIARGPRRPAAAP